MNTFTRKNKTKEKKRMQELLRSEDIEMVQLGITLMKHLLKRDKWEETLLLAFAIIEKGRFVGQKWEWQINEEDEVGIEPIQVWHGYTNTTYTTTNPYWLYGGTGTNVTLGGVSYGTGTTSLTVGTNVTCTPTACGNYVTLTATDP